MKSVFLLLWIKTEYSLIKIFIIIFKSNKLNIKQLEFLKNLFTPVYDRVKSPFYSTFVVSWLLINWKVIYALLSNDLHFSGYNLFHYLQFRLNILENPLPIIVYPVTLSALYIFGLPYIDLFIFSFSENKKQEKLENKYKITKQYTVSGEKFIDLLLNFKKQKDELAKLDEEVKEKEAIWISKEKDHNVLLNKYSNLETTLLKSLPTSLSAIFQGNWVCKYRKNLSEEPKREEFEIEGNIYRVLSIDSTEKIDYEIKNIIYDINNKKLSFIKIKYNSSKEFSTVKLVELFEKGQTYSGTEKTFYLNSRIEIIHVNYSPVFESEN